MSDNKLSDKHAEQLGRCLQNTGIINVNEDEYLHIARLVEGVYLYIQREAERDLRDERNGKND